MFFFNGFQFFFSFLNPLSILFTQFRKIKNSYHHLPARKLVPAERLLPENYEISDLVRFFHSFLFQKTGHNSEIKDRQTSKSELEK